MKRTTRSRVRVTVLTALLALMAAAGHARASVDGDVRAGIYPNADAVSVGGGILTNLGGPGSNWYFNPNVEVAMGDRRDIVAMSGDIHYDFATGSRTSFWMGAGPALLVTDHPNSGSETDLGVNVLTGVGATRGTVRPFAQLRGTMSDQNQVTIAGGIRF